MKKIIKSFTDAIEVVEGGTEFVHLFGRKTLGISHHNLKSYFTSFCSLGLCGSPLFGPRRTIMNVPGFQFR